MVENVVGKGENAGYQLFKSFLSHGHLTHYRTMLHCDALKI